MNEESVYDGDDIDGADEEDFIITNLDSVHDLDDALRPNEAYLARGPFKVHSPRTQKWTWGYRLEQVGRHLVFQDGSELGRTVMSDGMSMHASDDGSIIWLFGFDDDGLTVLTLSTATIDDYRTTAPKGIAIESFTDGARVVMAELEKKRLSRFGLEHELVFTGRLGLVFRDDPECTVEGLYYFDHAGGMHRRANGRWIRGRLSDGFLDRSEWDNLFVTPILSAGIEMYDSFSRLVPAIPLARFDPWVYPKFDSDGPEFWNDMFDQEEVVD